MNTMTLQLSKQPLTYLRLILNVQRILQNYVRRAPRLRYTTSIDSIDAFTSELLQRHKTRTPYTNIFAVNELSIRCFVKTENPSNLMNVAELNDHELNQIFVDLITNNKHKEIKQWLNECLNKDRYLTEQVVKKLLRTYSLSGKSEMVQLVQELCKKVNCNLYLRNGEFLHYLAKAECMKGNSEKGLLILKDCYTRHVNLRSLYRVIFRELIQDSVLNRSEASLVIFKNNVIEFSERWRDHYPLICLWHICWSSTWFSDQMLSIELFESSSVLRDIVKDKATAFSISVLRNEYNEDAVVRLLQMLLKEKMMNEYVKVLQVLFNEKLRNHDVRGCTEILRNCDVLGVQLPADQQGRYIRLMINGKDVASSTAQPESKHFKLKF